MRRTLRYKVATRYVAVLATLFLGLTCDEHTQAEEEPHFGLEFTWHLWQINVSTHDSVVRFPFEVTYLGDTPTDAIATAHIYIGSDSTGILEHLQQDVPAPDGGQWTSFARVAGLMESALRYSLSATIHFTGDVD